jgi:dinuclear metal center YbgI/SA1388 family protein
MIVRDVHEILEAWAPKEIAWERDNIGLQVGSMLRRVQKILVSLDVTDEVVREAREKKIDLIISHHPLLFHPVKSVSTEDRVGRLIHELARNGIALYAAHTNLDFAEGGVSFALAARLGLRNPVVLQKDQLVLKKVVVFVPADHIESVSAAMADAGAGGIGLYDHCSFRTRGTGTFRPLAGAKPFIGTKGRLERVEEVRLEMVVQSWKLDTVLRAMKRSHPYEEVAYDVYNLSNPSPTHGSGAIGELPGEMPLAKFLAHLTRTLRIPGLRFSGNLRSRIKRVAVCGGSGSNYLQAAIRQGADAFVTADLSYHVFQESDGRIALIDTGHFETEQPVIPHLVGYLKRQLAGRRERVRVLPSNRMKNFVQYYHS